MDLCQEVKVYQMFLTGTYLFTRCCRSGNPQQEFGGGLMRFKCLHAVALQHNTLRALTTNTWRH